MTYSNDFLEQIRAACPMETIAGNYVNLIRRGRHYVCNCPFHSEKSPSCTIFPETQSFYCFGCGAGGDVITWVRRMDNLEFTDAVKQLAERCGLQVPTDREADRRAYLRTRVFAVNRETANFYFRNLISGSDKRGLQYFISRQLKPETIKKYGLGYASDSWNALTDYLLQKGFTEEELLLANVAHRSNKGNLYDAFRLRRQSAGRQPAKVSEHGKNTGVRQGQQSVLPQFRQGQFFHDHDSGGRIYGRDRDQPSRLFQCGGDAGNGDHAGTRPKALQICQGSGHRLRQRRSRTAGNPEGD